MASEWTVILRPASSNTDENAGGENRSGLVVLLTDGEGEHEMVRVAFVRRAAKAKANRDRTFEEVLEEEIAKAQQAADAMNELDAEHVRLRDLADQATAEHIAAILKGTGSKVPV